jgi:hypothetical protein
MFEVLPCHAFPLLEETAATYLPVGVWVSLSRSTRKFRGRCVTVAHLFATPTAFRATFPDDRVSCREPRLDQASFLMLLGYCISGDFLNVGCPVPFGNHLRCIALKDCINKRKPRSIAALTEGTSNKCLKRRIKSNPALAGYVFSESVFSFRYASMSFFLLSTSWFLYASVSHSSDFSRST